MYKVMKWLPYLLFTLSAASLRAHDLGMAGERQLDWQTDQITHVIAFGNGSEAGERVTLDGEACVEGSQLLFRVRDQFAFDIDETVRLEVEFYLRTYDTRVAVVYERNGEGIATIEAGIPAYKKGSRKYKSTFALDRARFANRGLFHSDFWVGAVPGDSDASSQRITICKISLKRSYTTSIPKEQGQIALDVTDETGEPTPARVGIYDATGRFPLPSNEAVSIKRFNDETRSVTLNQDLPWRHGAVHWPVRNPSAFYINGSYHAKLPAGQYDLVIAKGMEYRIVHRTLTIERDKTQPIIIKLQRWNDLPAKGWFSGDDHIHYIRTDKNDDRALLLFAQAEDLHVANILQMGNIIKTYFEQYAWSPVRAARDKPYIIVPGQEDPRTSRRGHTLHLNLREPVHPEAERYLLYHETFAKTRAQNAVVGYAHVKPFFLTFAHREGMALDVPFGLIDFAEVMQFGTADTEVWFDFLNLGYKLAPSAGTDYPYGSSILGAERSYVHVKGPFTAQSWFDGLKRGATFVTNGPMLELSVNGQGMGSELSLQSGDQLVIEAEAAMNPDIDSLDRVDLIEQGEIIKTVTAQGGEEAKLRLHYETTARSGTWFVVRAYGKKQRKDADLVKFFGKGASRTAMSGAVYVRVDGDSFWKPSAVPSIVGRLKQDMQKLTLPERDRRETCCELWETQNPSLQYWDAQEAMLRHRIEQVNAIYDDLAKRARQ